MRAKKPGSRPRRKEQLLGRERPRSPNELVFSWCGETQNHGKKICINPLCRMPAHHGQTCARHREYKKCKISWCKRTSEYHRECCRHHNDELAALNKIRPPKAKLKHKPKPQRKKCLSEGCNKFAQNNGVCRRHGAQLKICKAAGCCSIVKKKGLCSRHFRDLLPSSEVVVQNNSPCQASIDGEQKMSMEAKK